MGLFSKVEGTHESLETNPSLFVAGASSTLLPSRNSVTSGKECFLKIILFKVGKGSLGSN
jgi:hypothetical protein